MALIQIDTLVGYENVKSYYTVDENGNVYGYNGGILSNYKSKDGYIHVKCYRKSDGKFMRVPLHRILALAFIENPENKTEVDHINRDRTDYRLENLRWATRKENANNRAYPKTYTTDETKVNLYNLYNYETGELIEENISKKTLAEKYKVHKPHRIIQGKRLHEKGFTVVLVQEGTKKNNKRPY